MRIVLSLLLAVMFAMASGAALADEASGLASPFAEDLLCAHAPEGTVRPVPSPFNLWLVLVCGPQSQALVPIEGMAWLAHGTDTPVSILALPPDATPVPRSAEYNPSYSVRFKSLFAAEVKDAKRTRIMAMLDERIRQSASASSTNGTPPRPLPKIDHVFQLDAVSIIYDMRYNIYFFVSDKLPVAGIACVDGCKRSLFFDIVSMRDVVLRR
jgi:hypothetical protein